MTSTIDSLTPEEEDVWIVFLEELRIRERANIYRGGAIGYVAAFGFMTILGMLLPVAGAIAGIALGIVIGVVSVRFYTYVHGYDELVALKESQKKEWIAHLRRVYGSYSMRTSLKALEDGLVRSFLHCPSKFDWTKPPRSRRLRFL